jgi:hypothetical protein
MILFVLKCQVLFWAKVGEGEDGEGKMVGKMVRVRW